MKFFKLRLAGQDATWRLCNREAREAPHPGTTVGAALTVEHHRLRRPGRGPPVISSLLSEAPAVRITAAAAAADKEAPSASRIEKPLLSRVARAPDRVLAFYEAGGCDGL
ncbi:hypothetical protein NDU88_004049 [Pleurodeles waltl]|uniref:Uncharacterized protein n=1 Tax=Pleurodeles waltl TaxID=8319 RepID=A0AAV7VF06_PLEWA|nr:hypothetical protein NDU88_004049 [Pleurodeles waltl]